MSDSKKTPVIKSNKVYDVLKYVAQIFLPAAGTLYFGLAQAWGWSNGTEVVGSIVAFDTFLGVLLHISNTQYESSGAKYDGEMVVTEQPGGMKNFSLELNHEDPGQLEKQKDVVFKVTKHRLHT